MSRIDSNDDEQTVVLLTIPDVICRHVVPESEFEAESNKSIVANGRLDLIRVTLPHKDPNEAPLYDMVYFSVEDRFRHPLLPKSKAGKDKERSFIFPLPANQYYLLEMEKASNEDVKAFEDFLQKYLNYETRKDVLLNKSKRNTFAIKNSNGEILATLQNKSFKVKDLAQAFEKAASSEGDNRKQQKVVVSLEDLTKLAPEDLSSPISDMTLNEPDVEAKIPPTIHEDPKEGSQKTPELASNLVSPASSFETAPSDIESSPEQSVKSLPGPMPHRARNRSGHSNGSLSRTGTRRRMTEEETQRRNLIALGILNSDAKYPSGKKEEYEVVEKPTEKYSFSTTIQAFFRRQSTIIHGNSTSTATQPVQPQMSVTTVLWTMFFGSRQAQVPAEKKDDLSLVFFDEHGNERDVVIEDFKG